MNKNIYNFLYLYIGIVFILVICIFWVVGVSDNRFGYFFISLGVVIL